MPPLVMKEPQGGILNQTSHLIIKRQIQYAPLEAHPVGHFGSGLQRARPRNDLPVHQFRRARPRPEARAGAEHRDRALCDGARRAVHAARGGRQPRPADARSARSAATASTTRSTSRRSACRRAPTTPSSTTTWRTTQGMSIVAVANVDLRRPHARPLPQRSGHRGGRAAAAGEGAARHPDRDGAHRGRRARQGRRRRARAPTRASSSTRLQALRSTSLMSNGRYSVMVTATGSGYSRWDDLAVTRWQADPTEDRMGTFIFLRDAETGDWWSATAEPKQAPGETAPDAVSATTRRASSRRSARCAPRSNASSSRKAMARARRITIFNDGDDRPPHRGHLLRRAGAGAGGHRQRASGLLEDVRRDRDRRRTTASSSRAGASARPSEPDIALAHFVTDRVRLAARRRGRDRPPRLHRPRPHDRRRRRPSIPARSLPASQGFVLDPVMSLRRRVRVPANKKVSLTFWTVVGAEPRRGRGGDRRGSTIRRASRARRCSSWTRSQVQTRHIGLTPRRCRQRAEAGALPDLSRSIAAHRRRKRSPPGLGRQSALWPMSISGDFPIFALRIGDVADLEIVAQALRYPGIHARARPGRRPRHRQRAGVVLRAGPAAGDRSAVREQPPARQASSGRASTSSRCAAT